MGLDGGTVASRTDLLRRASWRLTNVDDGAHRSTRGGQLGVADALATNGIERHNRHVDVTDAFAACALSGALFPAKPAPGTIVACALGQLYMRDSVVEFLGKSGQFRPDMCDTSALDAAYGHLERLRSVFDVTLEPNPSRQEAARSAAAGEGAVTTRPGPWRCPVDREVSTNGQHAFVALRPCGHVLRERVANECSVHGSVHERRRAAPAATSAVAGAASSSSDGSSRASDGISTIEGGSWECPVCAAPVEVMVKLVPEAHVVDKVRLALSAEREARRRRKAAKRKRQAEDATEQQGLKEWATS